MQEVSKDKFKKIKLDSSESNKMARPQISYWQDAWRRLKSNKVAILSLIILVLIIIMTIVGPALSGYSYQVVDGANRDLTPSSAHWFGTDELGRDLFARVWQAGRVSIVIGVVGALVSAVVGTLYGGISAYFGGKIDNIMMRIVEIMISIPYLLVVILVSIVTDSKSLGTMILALTITGWCNTARMVRGQMLQVKSQEYILAAETLGVKPFNIIRKHMIPNVLNILIVSISFDIPKYIFAESFLSYIGLGIQPPSTSWGALASAAQQNFIFYPYQLFFPGLMIALTMLSFTLLGDGLRDALDPRLRE